MSKDRKDVFKNDCWNLEPLFKDLASWDAELKKFLPSTQKKPIWPSLHELKGTLKNGADQLLQAIKLSFEIEQKLVLFYTWAHLKHDEDIAEPTYKNAYEKISSLLHNFSEETSWILPEILALPKDLLNSYLNDEKLADYKFYLKKLTRLQPHTLCEESELLLALAAEPLEGFHKAFSQINDADFKFLPVTDSQNNSLPLSHASYGLYLRSSDRELRQNCFTSYHAKYKSFENTICELLSGTVKKHIYGAKTRKYSSALNAALYPKNIDPAVYQSLIETVNQNLPKLHSYLDLRQKFLNLDKLHYYDLYVPLLDKVDMQISYDEAVELVIESVKPLGQDYQNILAKGLKEQMWVDKFENKNKRSGAYSSGCYGSMPYILMNYKGIIRDLFTLAHEAGHSMHSYLSRSNQPYHYSDYSIFLAEVASTFNEDLLNRLLLQKFSDKEKQAYLINQQIEDIRATLFRQTMFAEFELLIHSLVEKSVPLTPHLLNEEYHKLNRKYFGPNFVIDKELEVEWSRIPHFYYNFYVFQYATGISAALTLSEKVVNGAKVDRDAYLNFLKGGSSKYPIDLLLEAGVDMRSSLPVQTAINKFDNLVQKLKTVL